MIRWNLRAMVEQHLESLLQFAGYVAVSGCALVVDVLVYWLMLGIANYAFVAATCGYVCGVLAHYALSSRIVFRTRFDQRGMLVEAPTIVKFFAAGFLGLVVTATIVGVLADGLGVHPLLAKLVSAGCSFVVVFTTLRFFVFRLPSPPAVRTA
ncbi:MAG: GtrA family protein [Hyphomicrobium sp.]